MKPQNQPGLFAKQTSTSHTNASNKNLGSPGTLLEGTRCKDLLLEAGFLQVYIYIYMYNLVCTCTCIPICICYIYTRIYIYIYTYIHTYIRMCVKDVNVCVCEREREIACGFAYDM